MSEIYDTAKKGNICCFCNSKTKDKGWYLECRKCGAWMWKYEEKSGGNMEKYVIYTATGNMEVNSFEDLEKGLDSLISYGFFVIKGIALIVEK